MRQDANHLIFELVDNTRIDKYNESCKMVRSWYGTPEEETLSIEDYFYMCKDFAAALGFCEKTIEEWFGEG
jgi:hypothetical protein